MFADDWLDHLPALLAAQRNGDPFAEADAILRVFREGRFRKNGSTPKSKTQLFAEKIAYGMSECWFWVGNRCDLGYGIFQNQKAHRVSWEMHRGPIPKGLKVCHRCDVRCCVNPDHLFLGTQADNVRDMVEKGRGVSVPLHGERNPQSRLTAEQVREMRRIRAANGTSYRLLGEMFGVTTMTAHRAVTGRSWNESV